MSKAWRIIPAIAMMVAATIGGAAEFSMKSASGLVLRGQVIEDKQGKPLANAQVSILTEYDTYRTYTDADGTFSLNVTSAKELQKFDIVFSHPDYREKYFNTAFDYAMRGTFEAKVEPGSVVRVKHHKTKGDLKCGDALTIPTKDGKPVTCGVACGSSPRIGVDLADGNRLGVSASGPFQLFIDKERIEVRGIKDVPVTLDVTAVMYRR